MRRIQTFVILFLLVAILIVTIFFPITASEIKDGIILRKVKTQLLEENLSIDEVSVSVVDKISLISNYKKSGHNIAKVSQEKQLGSTLMEKNIPSIALNELEKLKRIGVFPEINLNDKFKYNYTFITYTDIDEPIKNTRVWDIKVSSDKNIIYLIIDADTHLIYQFYVWSNEGFLPAMDSEAIPQKFAEYIGIEWESKSLYQLGGELYSAANGEIFYNFHQEKEEKGLKGFNVYISNIN